jgi:hypothetical protein
MIPLLPLFILNPLGRENISQNDNTTMSKTAKETRKEKRQKSENDKLS